MKKILSTLLAAVLLFSLLSPIQALADSIPQWDTGSNIHTINVSDFGLFQYIYSAKKNETVEFKVSANGGVNMTATNTDHEPISVTRMFNNDTISFIVSFEANKDYILKFLCFVEGSQSVYTAPWTSCQSRTITPGSTHSVTVDPDRSYSYLVSVPTSGVYTLIANGTNFVYGVQGYPEVSQEYAFNPLFLGSWYDNEKFRTSYYFQSDKLYAIEVFANEITEQKTESFTLQAGCPTQQYGVMEEGSKDITIDPAKYNQQVYAFVPKASGKYSFSCKGGLNVTVDNESRNLTNTSFITANNDYGYIYTLEKGQPYTITVSNYQSAPVTDTLTVKHYTSIESAQLKIRRSASSYYEIAVITEPACAIAEGVTWTVSDPSVFSLNASNDVASLNCLKDGKATVTAKVGSKTVSLELTSPPTPVALQLNKEERISILDYPAGAYFFPTASGTYEFRIVPDIYPGYENIRFILSSGDNDCWQDLYLKQTKTIQAELKEGKKYEISLSNGCAAVTVNMLSSETPSTAPTDSAISSQPATQATQPSQGGSSTQPTQGPTTPSQPSEDPTEPIAGTDPSVTEGSAPSESTGDMTPEPSTGDDPGMIITDNEMSEAIGNVSGNVISFSLEGTWNRSFEISSEALRLAADQDCALSLDFLAGVNVFFSENILKTLTGLATGEGVTVSVVPHSFGDLNESQQKAMDGLGFAWLLDIDLTVDREAIHNLGGKAQITFPNNDMDEEWTVLYLAEDGSTEVMDITCDEKITFSTDHLSFYALVYQRSEQPPIEDNSPKGWIAIPIILVVLAGGGVAAFFVLKKKGLIPFKK